MPKQPSYSSPRYIPNKKEILIPAKEIFMEALFIAQNLETSQMPSNRTDKQTIIYSYNGVLYGNRKQEATATCKIMSKSPNIVLNERNQTQEVILNESVHLYKVQKQANDDDRNENNGYPLEEVALTGKGSIMPGLL